MTIKQTASGEERTCPTCLSTLGRRTYATEFICDGCGDVVAQRGTTMPQGWARLIARDGFNHEVYLLDGSSADPHLCRPCLDGLMAVLASNRLTRRSGTGDGEPG